MAKEKAKEVAKEILIELINSIIGVGRKEPFLVIIATRGMNGINTQTKFRGDKGEVA